MDAWFTEGIKKWYKVNKRQLPWRDEKDPYRIWLSEIILQQTQVKQGLSYYLKFIKNYPTVKHLARATEDKVLKDWQGLGYYSRARNLQSAAKSVVKDYKGIFPDSYEKIRSLKGVGEYTASAIASFAFDKPHAVVDGNVYRLLSRVFGIEEAIDSGPGKKKFRELADALLDRKDPALHNQAIMEFGSQYCKPANPDCSECIFKEKCYAFLNGRVGDLPFKEKKVKVNNRYFHYLVIADPKRNILVNKRKENDIWKGLYDFVLIEKEKEMKAGALLQSKEFRRNTGENPDVLFVSKTYKHVLSHQHLFTRFYVVKARKKHRVNGTGVNIDSLTKFAFPRLIEKFLNDCNLSELL